MSFINSKIKIYTFAILSSGIFLASAQTKMTAPSTETSKSGKILPTNLKWSERMLLSEMNRFPESWMLDFSKSPKWTYPAAIVLDAAEQVYAKTGKKEYYNYISSFGEKLVKEDGTIVSYELEKYNIDLLNSGNVLLYLYEKEKKEKYLKALQTLRLQIDGQPRTNEGSFWHKKIYPNQVWLDGLYMGMPFYTHFTKDFTKGTDATKAYDDIVMQFDSVQKNLLDKKTGLLYHAWDESKEQAWADKQTGLSPNFWGRAMGWYGMAMVDVLDYLPKDHPGRARIISYIKSFSDAVIKYQDKKSGLWYQVLDKPLANGNYEEATASAMFVYTIIKSVNKGYLPKSYKAAAKKGYDGIIKDLITVDENGVVNLNKCCAVAGLGGKPYRDGSYEYYVNEKIRSNDAKGTGPFILASLEFEK
ncbi:glycoside hydrolase family 88 protein [Epilithonimonas ginsengisoli]|uniref:Glycoside hydrolase family 88 protein n=1 Tax=Epilithonimonas ginsengisoli TaxID=1245592 RepID=A0ABU4JFD1_9FLAO|nr:MULTISPECIES: glycoside hydrolase family 88 protein [Chryseobacterium group]MBV6879688.1 glycoside hydrolase family 88 protein [Epilithonimonas sp. FP105]MDW8548327.1 glycoside hydrolase family 88 protein [Epilithonimonas ginsengisoli]OAH72561.1 glycosyl hydrolase family 88 [Chryseobacterium sp. FP211-J200]